MKKSIVALLILTGVGIAGFVIRNGGVVSCDPVKTQDAIPPSSEGRSTEALPKFTPPKFSIQNCPAHLMPIFGLESSTGYVQRKRVVQSLGAALVQDEINALQAYLHLKPKEVRLNQGGYEALGDVIMLKLEEQVPFPCDYTDHLIAVYQDVSRTVNWRDYCIQHLGASYQRVPREKQLLIRQTFEQALTHDPAIAGTILLAMKFADLPLDVNQAMKVASNPNAPSSSRLSALHLAADAHPHEALPLAREIAPSKETVHLRMAAMAVIGKWGDTSDITMLTKYTTSSDIRLRESSKAALKRINARQNQLAAEQ